VTRRQESLIDDRLWELVEPLIPERPPPKGPGGRPRIDDRAALEGIVFVLSTGCRWRDLPQKLGCGSGHTAWRRLREWQDAGVWDRLHQVILIELREAEVLDWTRCCVDAVAVRAKRGASLPVRALSIEANPVRSTTSCATATDFPCTYLPRRPIPTTANCSSRCWRPTRAFPMVVADRAGARTSCMPTRGTTTAGCRSCLHRRGIGVRIARRGVEDPARLGRVRWVVERTVSWLLRFKRLGLRYDRTEATLRPLLTLAASIINLRRLLQTESSSSVTPAA
jgi:transposase